MEYTRKLSTVEPRILEEHMEYLNLLQPVHNEIQHVAPHQSHAMFAPSAPPHTILTATPAVAKYLTCAIVGCASSYIYRPSLHRHMVLKHGLTPSGSTASREMVEAAKRNSTRSTTLPAHQQSTSSRGPSSMIIDHVRKHARMPEEHVEYKLKPAHNQRKADPSIELHNVLNESETSDDIEAKLYQQTFRRLRNINPITRPLARRHRRGQQQTSTLRSNRKTQKTQQWSPF